MDIYLRVRSYVEKHGAGMLEEVSKRYREILDEMLGFLPAELQAGLHVRRKMAHGGSPVIEGNLDEAMASRQFHSVSITSTAELTEAIEHPLAKPI